MNIPGKAILLLAGLSLALSGSMAGGAEATSASVSIDTADSAALGAPDRPVHLAAADPGKITPRVVYRNVISYGKARGGGQGTTQKDHQEQRPEPGGILLLGSGLVVLGVLVRRLRRGPR